MAQGRKKQLSENLEKSRKFGQISENMFNSAYIITILCHRNSGKLSTAPWHPLRTLMPVFQPILTIKPVYEKHYTKKMVHAYSNIPETLDGPAKTDYLFLVNLVITTIIPQAFITHI
jgi:hypothetical protein